MPAVTEDQFTSELKRLLGIVRDADQTNAPAVALG
jgi:hypothetical protein